MKNLVLVFLFSVISVQMCLSQCVEGDCKNGYGTIMYQSGNKYQGEFSNGLKHGYGKFIWKSGSKYKGDWVQNKREGDGEEILTNGNRYVGQWLADKKHGTGVIYDASNNILQQGTWSNGTFVNSTQPVATTTTPTTRSTTTRSNTASSSSSNKKAKTMDSYLNLGVGLGNIYNRGFTYSSDVTQTGIPPVSLSVDLFEAGDNIKIGGFLGYTSSKISNPDVGFGTYGWTTSYFILGVRGTYSYDLFNNPKIDTYAGAMLGYNVVKVASFGSDLLGTFGGTAASGITYAGFIGARYLFKENLGAFAELGYGISYLNVGLTKKF